MFLKRKSIDQWVEQCASDPDAVLVDVRETDEFSEGHIPGAVNIPLSRIQSITLDKDTPLYLYCLMGTRSMRALGILKRMGYQNVTSIGGINAYQGEVEL